MSPLSSRPPLRKPLSIALDNSAATFCHSTDGIMKKSILITGCTDGIGLATAKKLVSLGHNVLLHGRNTAKLKQTENTLSKLVAGGQLESYLSDLSRMSNVEALANAVIEKHKNLDVLINNAGVFSAANPITTDGLDIRFVVNTIAPYLLTLKLMPILGSNARVINLASAAQSPVNPKALAGKQRLADDLNAYAQSKLALIMWSHQLALSLKDNGPVIIAVNPGSLLATKMVKNAFNMAGKDVNIGANILTQLALDEQYTTATGKYFDNDSGRFASPHRDALDPQKSKTIVNAIETILQKLAQ